MGSFGSFFNLGLDHILTPYALDHLLFLLALVAPYGSWHWRPTVALITAFTVGHSLTLALATLDVLPLSQQLAEFLIPPTILITGGWHLWRPQPRTDRWPSWGAYGLAVGFGLIHGLAFAGSLAGLLRGGNVVGPLLAFNLGVEVGHLAALAILVALAATLQRVFHFQRRDWTLVVAALAMGGALALWVPNPLWRGGEPAGHHHHHHHGPGGHHHH